MTPRTARATCRRAVATLALLATATAHAGAPVWKVAKPDVVVTCDLTVGGRFEATTSSLAGRLETTDTSPDNIAGSLTVDLTTLETGIDLRDTHMKERYLETTRGEGYAQATLSDIVLEARTSATFEGRSPLRATLRLHGKTLPIVGQAILAIRTDGLHVDGTLAISLAQFDIPEPRYLGIGVRDEVHVRATFVATEEQP